VIGFIMADGAGAGSAIRARAPGETLLMPNAAPRPSPPTPSPLMLACVLALLFGCAFAAGARAIMQWRAADPWVAAQDVMQRRALQLNNQIRSAQSLIEAGLAAYARSGELSELRERLEAADGAGFVVFSSDGQPIAASDAAAVAPARQLLTAAAGALPFLQLLEQRQQVGVVAKGGQTAVVLLLSPAGAEDGRTRIAQTGAPAAESQRIGAPVGYGRLQVLPTAEDRTRWLTLGADLLIALIPLTMGVLLYGWTRRTTRAVLAVAAELDRARKRFRIAVNGAGAGVFEFNAEGEGTLQISSRLRGLLQAGGESLSVDTFLEKVAETDRAAVRAGLQKAAETGVMEIAFRSAARNGAWIEMRGLAIEDPGAGAVRIVGTGLDDTPRREAEARASAMERRLRAAIDGYTGPFALWDSRRRLVTCNASYIQAFGLAQHVKPGADYGAIAAAGAAAIRRQQHDQSDPNVRELELKTGAWLKVVERSTPDGGLVTVGTDITALKQQEGMLRTAAKEMRQKMLELERLEGRNRELAKKYEEEKHRAEDASRAKSLFLANMSHELRTPLNAIIGFSEIISSELLGDLGNDKYKEYATDILSSGQLLLDLINDILDMAKIEAGKWSLALSEVDPEETITQVVRLMGRRAEEKACACWSRPRGCR